MMSTLPYRECIDKLNDGTIRKIVFQVENYAHYKSCSMERRRDCIKGRAVNFIDVKLTEDGTERVCFFGKFNESYKLFGLGRKGRFTLEQIWDRIRLIRIEYEESGASGQDSRQCVE